MSTYTPEQVEAALCDPDSNNGTILAAEVRRLTEVEAGHAAQFSAIYAKVRHMTCLEGEEAENGGVLAMLDEIGERSNAQHEECEKIRALLAEKEGELSAIQGSDSHRAYRVSLEQSSEITTLRKRAETAEALCVELNRRIRNVGDRFLVRLDGGQRMSTLTDTEIINWMQNNPHNIQYPHRANGNKFRLFSGKDDNTAADTLRESFALAMKPETTQ